MDFASLMSAEISKSRPAATTSPSIRPTSTPPPQQKYLKRAEIEAQRQAAYALEQSRLLEERTLKASQKRKYEDEESARTQAREEKKRRLAEESRIRREEEDDKKERARRKRLGLPDLPPKGSIENGEQGGKVEGTDIDEEELVRKIRELGEPARLFGESHAQRLRRYRVLTAPKAVYYPGPIPTLLEPVAAAEMFVPAKPPTAGTPERAFLFRQLASYFNLVLSEWTVALDKRPDAVKESFQGKQAEGAMVQSRENMRPLFRRFEKGELEDGILEPVVEIVQAAQQRRYVDANDGYLRLSIGKAAWPIGVTMVGIHERSAREKLHESDKGAAHIMSDEVTRKFLQSIKRCLSFAQTRWVPEDQLQLMG
ncbi:mRNA splicing protein prp18 [Ptychographa xylographoides]|nr:mRNA splicing protein prp18 [Ptychographa xylographoides]